ncbi:MAG TPA: SPOR domain-containing protein, partial [Longimicrobiales bacterium]|nr:SPOR domain-containing protein [Longimicrobiales bacterium]
MERESPAWQPFDSGVVGESLHLSPPTDDDPARVLVFLAAPDAAGNGWAPRAAVDVVRELASEEGRTLLADLALDAPRLHEAFGVPNGEGVSDVFLWGASFQRVSRRVEPGLLFAPAGTVVANPASVARSPRWDAVVDGFRQARATLAVYLPRDAAGAEALLDRASDIVVLAGRDEMAGLELDPWSDRVRGVFGPSGPGDPSAAAAVTGGTGPRAEEEWTSGTGLGADEGWEEEPVSESRGVRAPLWVVVALVLALAILVAAWNGWLTVPGLSSVLGGSAEVEQPQEEVVRSASELDADEATPGEAGGAAADPAAAPSAGAAPDVAGPVQRFSLTLAAYPDAASALEQRAQLSARRPDVPFLLAPVEVNGRIFYRLLAGVAENPGAVETLRASLGGSFGAEAASRWILRDTRWAYLLGEAPSLTDARARARELASGGVQPYVLSVSGADGPA